MIRTFISGASGRMGRTIQDVMAEKNQLRFVGGLGEASGERKIQKKLPKATKGVDIVIDFSSADIFSEVLSWCVAHKLPLVSGTTGLSATQEKEIRAASKKIPLLWASNMSVGMALVKSILYQLSIPPEFDVHLLEYHHIKKKDAPSGTAKDLEAILKKKTKKYAGTQAIRGGGIFGVHRVDLMSESEVIVIEHTALDRKVFARGAVCAAEWLVNQKPGLYSMQDVISL